MPPRSRIYRTAMMGIAAAFLTGVSPFETTVVLMLLIGLQDSAIVDP